MSSNVIFCPRSFILWNIYASYTVIAAIGMAVLCCIPVCTEETENEVTDLTSAATAPYLAALSAPEDRY